jgi:hypothetical protein
LPVNTRSGAPLCQACQSKSFFSNQYQGSKYKNKLAFHFIILLGALVSYGLPSMYFHLPSVKFGLQFGHWQAAISSPEYDHSVIKVY